MGRFIILISSRKRRVIKIISAKVRFNVKIPFEKLDSVLTSEDVGKLGCGVLLACMENADFDFDDEGNFHVHGDLLIKDVDKYKNMINSHDDAKFVPISELPGFRKN